MGNSTRDIQMRRNTLRVLGIVLIVIVAVISAITLFNWVETNRMRARIKEIIADRPAIISYFSKEGTLKGFNNHSFGDGIQGVFDSFDYQTLEEGYLPIPIPDQSSVWDGVLDDVYALEIDNKLVGVRMNILPMITWDKIPFLEFATELVGKKPDTITDKNEAVWSFPDIKITTELLPIYPVAYGSGIPPQGITIIMNEAVGGKVSYKSGQR